MTVDEMTAVEAVRRFAAEHGIACDNFLMDNGLVPDTRDHTYEALVDAIQLNELVPTIGQAFVWAYIIDQHVAKRLQEAHEGLTRRPNIV